MTPSLRLWISLAGVVVSLAALWLAGDAIYAHWTCARGNAPDARRASTAPFTLNPDATPALLLIHGFADGPSVFAKLAPTLADSGFAVRALHLTGSGVPPAQMAGTTLDTWRADIDREIAGLRIRDSSRPVWLVGHSLGGTLAYDAALRPSNHVAGLVLLAPLVEVSGARSPLLPPRQWFRLLDRMLVFSEVVESRLPADLHDPAARALYKTDKFIHRDIYRALFDAIDAIRPRAADWRGPLLMVVSPSDQIVDSAATKYFFSATNAAPANLAEHHAGGHVLPLDTGHDKIAAKTVRFIRESPMP
jgi:esterase/lipase